MKNHHVIILVTFISFFLISTLVIVSCNNNEELKDLLPDSRSIADKDETRYQTYLREQGVTDEPETGTDNPVIVRGTPGDTIVGHSPVKKPDDNSGHTGDPIVTGTGGSTGSATGTIDSSTKTPVYHFSFPSHAPYKFGDGFIGTTWVLNVRGYDVPGAWKEGQASSSLNNILTVVSDSELWIYSDLDLGGDTHKVPAYFDPPFDGDLLLNKNPPVKPFYYAYNKSNGVLTIWEDAGRTKRYGTLNFNGNKSDPKLISFSNLGYYPTTKSISLLGD